ncbi:triosephosphate isomerase [archaeon]|jgi:triosephosphate isomerase (TIM)|nr:triosephosphate isomerase [archaeon]MBT4241497.1 triosephosphate isomerase [archaeon]MBT4417632.1 triosephosphate isomerase [archaeon]
MVKIKEFFGANFKTNPSMNELYKLLGSYLNDGVAGNDDRDVVVFLSGFPLGHLMNSTDDFLGRLASKGIEFGCQKVGEFEEGSHTGEDSALWLRGLEVPYVLVGHSEERGSYEELEAHKIRIDNLFNRKIKTALENDLNVVYCIGESKWDRSAGMVLGVLSDQSVRGLDRVSSDKMESVTIAYEPRWSIGGEPPTLDEIARIHGSIKKTVGDGVRVVYGGGVNPGNIKGIMGLDCVDGVLVGGASLDAEKFKKIVEYR